MTEPLHARLGPWINAPTVLNKVLDYVEKAERPLTSGEIAVGLGIRRYRAALSLSRLCDKGMLVRWKAPMIIPHGFILTGPRRGGPGRFRANVWLYAMAVDNGDRR